MATYFLFGKYTSASVGQIDHKRTLDVVGLIEKHNGQITSMYGLLGIYDLVFIVNLPGNKEALQVSIELAQHTGIHFTSAPAIPIDQFDHLIGGKGDAQPRVEDLDDLEGLDDLDVD